MRSESLGNRPSPSSHPPFPPAHAFPLVLLSLFQAEQGALAGQSQINAGPRLSCWSRHGPLPHYSSFSPPPSSFLLPPSSSPSSEQQLANCSSTRATRSRLETGYGLSP
eukprot:4237015-Pyramimonas_sp.AAC.1